VRGELLRSHLRLLEVRTLRAYICELALIVPVPLQLQSQITDLEAERIFSDFSKSLQSEEAVQVWEGNSLLVVLQSDINQSYICAADFLGAAAGVQARPAEGRVCFISL
jgi:hypothetical protein